MTPIEAACAELVKVASRLRSGDFPAEAEVLDQLRAAWLIRGGEQDAWASDVARAKANADPEAVAAFEALLEREASVGMERPPAQPPDRRPSFPTTCLLDWEWHGGDVDDGMNVLAQVFVEVCNYDPQVVEDGFVAALRQVKRRHAS